MPKTPKTMATTKRHSIGDAQKITGYEHKAITKLARQKGALFTRPVTVTIMWNGKPIKVQKHQYFVDGDFVDTLAAKRAGIKEFDEKTETTKGAFLADQGVWYEDKITDAKKGILGNIAWEKRIIKGKRGPHIVDVLPDSEIKKIEEKLKAVGLDKIHTHNMYSWPKFLAMFFGITPPKQKQGRFDFLKNMVKWKIYKTGYGKTGDIEYLLPDDPQIKALEAAAWRLKKAIKKSMPAAEMARKLGKNNAYMTAAIKHGFMLKNKPEGPYHADRVTEFGGRYYINRNYVLNNKETLNHILDKAASFDSASRIKAKRDGVLQEYAGMAEVGGAIGLPLARAAAHKFSLGKFLKEKLREDVIIHGGRHFLSRKFFEHPENITRLMVIVERGLRELGLPRLEPETTAAISGRSKITKAPPKRGQVTYRWGSQQLEIRGKFENLVRGLQHSFGLPQEVADNYIASWTPGKIRDEHAKIMGLQYEHNLQKTQEDKEWYRKKIIQAMEEGGGKA